MISKVEVGARRAVVLLVDDSPADQVTVQRALEDGRVRCDLFVVDDGGKALSYLRREGDYEDQIKYPFPDLILMDINMPVLDGIETLKQIREDKKLDSVPVIMLTTSDSNMDVKQCYQMGANAYVTKPVEKEGFVRAVVEIEKFWFELVTLPEHK